MASHPSEPHADERAAGQRADTARAESRLCDPTGPSAPDYGRERRGGALQRTSRAKSADRSLAEHHGDGYAVVLSGGGADGAVGVRDIQEKGGIVLVQDPNDAEFPSMPRNALDAGADFVLPVADLARTQDFSGCKRATLMRRVARRMQVTHTQRRY
ncbi:MAG: chemotaxis protein CheB [Methylocystis sp.]